MSSTRPPRVVILVENLPVPMDRRTWQEARTLADAGWDVTVIGPRGQGSMRRLRDRIDGIEVLRYPQRAASGLAGYVAEYVPSMLFTAGWLAWTRRRGPIRVIHGCNPPDLFWIFGSIARIGGGAFVFDQHDVNPELSRTKFGEGGPGRILHWLTLAMERASYRAAAVVLAPNDSYAAIARRRGRLPVDRVVVVRNAPDTANYQVLAAEITPDPLRIGYIGVMGSQDGIDVLIDAWRSVVAEPDLASARLELIGDGEARPALEGQVDELGLRESVRFHGYLPPDEFVPLLAACQFTISPDPPTAFNDVSTMVKVVDSLVIGRPVVAFDLRETRNVLGGAGRLVKGSTAAALARTIVDLLRSPDEVARLAGLAAQRPADLGLDWSNSSAALVEAYETLRPRANGDPTGGPGSPRWRERGV